MPTPYVTSQPKPYHVETDHDSDAYHVHKREVSSASADEIATVIQSALPRAKVEWIRDEEERVGFRASQFDQAEARGAVLAAIASVLGPRSYQRAWR